jgi:hypothetical protein
MVHGVASLSSALGCHGDCYVALRLRADPIHAHPSSANGWVVIDRGPVDGVDEQTLLSMKREAQRACGYKAHEPSDDAD